MNLAVLGALVVLCCTAYADPQATRDDLEIRRILGVAQGTIRIAKDPRDDALYILRQDGAIERIDLAAAERVPAYSHRDHGIRSGFTGFAIGPDGSFYLASNRHGPRDSGQFALARGVLLGDDPHQRQWEPLDPDNLPADIPIDDILAATVFGRDLTTNIRYALKPNGDITLVPEGTVYTAADHGLSRPSALFIDDDGTFYVLKRIDLSGYNIATITKGEVDPSSGERTWFTLAETVPYARCDCIYNHEVNGLVVSPDNRSLFINSGSRTDHGEIQDGNGAFPGLRETALTAIILRLPTDARDLILPNDRYALLDQGFLFAEGLRNAYDLAFAPNGDLFATENGPGRDMAEELNWLRQGHHYGFPWRMGLEDTPQQFPDYDPATDFLLSPLSTAVREGYYHNDPSYPPPPRAFTDPVINLGPDADAYRDPADGRIKDASDEGVRFGTFTAHRSPLGLVFDMDHALAEPFRGDGFTLSWTPGDPNGDSVNGPFNDPSEDLLHLDLTKVGDQYEARVTRLVGGFSNPIDAEIIGHRLYVIEWGGKRGLWEITLPPAEFPPARLADAQVFSDLATQTPAAGVVPYQVNAPFWSDSATKTRFIRLPPGQRIDFADRGPWGFPDQTLLIKNFYLDLVRGDPASRRIIETRFLLKRGHGWDGYSYQWNEAGTDAFLLADSTTAVYVIDDPQDPVGFLLQEYYFPSRPDCTVCHTKGAGHVLGVQTPQLNTGAEQNQLHTLAQQGLFTAELPADLSSLPRLPNPFDPSGPLDLRARSYLHVNCAPCHRPESVGRTILDLRYDTPLAETNAIGAFPTLGDLGEPEALILTPGAPQLSTLYLRLLTLGTFRMPPLASSIIDQQGADLIAAWIANLDAAPAKAIPPAAFALDQNYPNPFNAITTIEFQLAAPAAVELAIYDAIGQKVRTLVAHPLAAGRYRSEWDGRDDAGHAVASGPYFYQLHAGAYRATKHLTLIK